VRFGLIPKLVLSTLLILVLAIGGLVAAVYWTFEPDLSDYLARVETEQLQPLADRIGREYEQRGDWAFLTPRPAHWEPMVNETILSSDPVEPGPDGGVGLSQEARSLLPRLSMDNMDGNPLINSPIPRRPDSTTQLITFPIMADGRQVATLKMVPTPIPATGLDRQYRTDQLRAFTLAGIPALLGTFLIALLLGSHFTIPLQRMKRRLHRLAQGDYQVRLPVERNDEFGQLAADFNHLATILERTEVLRREGMASVSHELRTPLSTMIAEVEAMRDGVRPLDARQLGLLAGNMEHLSQLVEDLYQLALADVGVLVMHRRPLDWGPIVVEALDTVSHKLSHRDITLNHHIQTGNVIEGDAMRLRQVVTNLLENCARYTQTGGEVTVSLVRNANRIRLRVADTGPGVDDATLESLFVRFFRADTSRSREHGGAGLGLSLVQAILKAHGGDIRADHAPEGGLAFQAEIELSAHKPGG